MPQFGFNGDEKHRILLCLHIRSNRFYLEFVRKNNPDLSVSISEIKTFFLKFFLPIATVVVETPVNFDISVFDFPLLLDQEHHSVAKLGTYLSLWNASLFSNFGLFLCSSSIVDTSEAE